MIIRQIEPRDHDALRELQKREGSKYENESLNFDGPNFVAGLVAVDDDDRPRICLSFRRTAEAHLTMDHSYDVPAFRLLALGELIEAAKPVMQSAGYEDVIATIGPDMPRGYLKRLKRFGCGILENFTLAKMWGEPK